MPRSPELARITFDKDARAITALGFSPDGSKLACVAADDQNTLYVYDWRRNRCLTSVAAAVGDPPQVRGLLKSCACLSFNVSPPRVRPGLAPLPDQKSTNRQHICDLYDCQVYGLEWNPYEVSHGATSQFVTFGKKHVKLWSMKEGTWAANAALFGKLPLQNATSAQWLPPKVRYHRNQHFQPLSSNFLNAVSAPLAWHVFKLVTNPTWPHQSRHQQNHGILPSPPCAGGRDGVACWHALR